MTATAGCATACRTQQLGALADAWQGAARDASREFLRRHGEASAAAAAAVRTAADALAALRDDLWHAVDAKVGAAMAIEERRQTERAEWLAAAQTVTTGAGDRAAASELVDQQVKPFVDNDIRSDWLTAMQTAMAAVTAAYDAAAAELAAEPDAVFDVPGDLGPSWTPPLHKEWRPLLQRPSSCIDAGARRCCTFVVECAAAPAAHAYPRCSAAAGFTADAGRSCSHGARDGTAFNAVSRRRNARHRKRSVGVRAAAG